MNKIVFKDIEIEVMNCCPFRYADGKEVLKITVNDTNSKMFLMLKELDGFDGTIGYYENNELKSEYEMYSSDFSCGYMNGIYNVELTKVGLTEQAVVSLQSQIDEIVTEVIPTIVGI